MGAASLGGIYLAVLLGIQRICPRLGTAWGQLRAELWSLILLRAVRIQAFERALLHHR